MIVVDSSAIVAVTNAEPEAERITRLIVNDDEVSISAATFVETAIVIRSQHGSQGVRRLHEMMEDMVLRTHPFNVRQADLAIEAYRRFGRGSGSPARLNFGDCFSYALARSLDAPLLFKGDDFFHTDIEPALVA
ncbi:type II toxin-antitoxin system VapC family toxin [Aurantimonas sp. C2-6-R+9]|uniref:type II toxin-antitoxin system VapC family toxin n=1 Tax=unclassified Aurantimonas TaxID=2638230 RepID=UPI002E190B6B|nr:MULTISPECIES: type II toxin-antitoxin system VapC family toxin [unclassified Aurantimonas]MEC5289598.1 type II toxin-antitoxin system VapC family toxin [Aurantimonas sp. C2-3-R2]MEC5323917.1 type II toxin-antitoxin system VapC family toxin [Aurantimonas sp. A3-2-R12]MEC5379563.1 type II toxin-antitoxin system VapC family toxin [Aurantimonas sp. C2-6-R+9]MEC5410679.1 type II toxin-antitoxin system VapC family toxin [Aurantimonas sp. C2-4-R8]